jgi:acetyltransferase-like isoleucine patch superfamily enzyme
MIESFLLKVKRAETPFYAKLNKTGRALLCANLPVPAFLSPLLRVAYHLHFCVRYLLRYFAVLVYRYPLFRSRCASIGRNLQMTFLPDITGHPKIYIGDNVRLFGGISVVSGRVFDEPKLVIGDGVHIGHQVFFTVNKEIIIDEEAGIASDCFIADSDAHPANPEDRVKNLPPSPEDIKPVHICRRAWIGRGSFIMKGVTVGEGALVAAASVVVNDVPPFSVAMGNPARIIMRADHRARSEASLESSPANGRM